MTTQVSSFLMAVVAIATVSTMTLVEAFHFHQPPALKSSSRFVMSTGPRTTSSTAVFMYDIPKPDEEKETSKTKTDERKPSSSSSPVTSSYWQQVVQRQPVDRWYKPPPPPEDQMVLTGDLLALFVYGFFDHFVCQDCTSALIGSADSTTQLAATAASLSQHYTQLSVPVWLDHAAWDSTQQLHILQAVLSHQMVTEYSPILQPTGMATCLLAGSWLLAGWFHRAFLFRNTVDCSTDHAVAVAGKTWITTCILMLATVSASHVICHCPMDVWWQGYTKGDVDYIFDSLTVLACWRFLASILLGYGGDSNDSK